MTAYTTISDALVQVGARPFATTIQALRDNPLAIQEGDATAPRIQRAALLDAIVNRVKLDTATGSQAYSFGGGGGNLTVTLDAYSFTPACTGGGSGTDFSLFAGASGVDAPRVRVSDSGTASGSVTWRYIVA